jgi:hypothetical protein
LPLWRMTEAIWRQTGHTLCFWVVNWVPSTMRGCSGGRTGGGRSSGPSRLGWKYIRLSVVTNFAERVLAPTFAPEVHCGPGFNIIHFEVDRVDIISSQATANQLELTLGREATTL